MQNIFFALLFTNQSSNTDTKSKNLTFCLSTFTKGLSFLRALFNGSTHILYIFRQENEKSSYWDIEKRLLLYWETIKANNTCHITDSLYFWRRLWAKRWGRWFRHQRLLQNLLYNIFIIYMKCLLWWKCTYSADIFICYFKECHL